MKRNEKGFSAIEIIMAIAIVGLAGAVGWMFWDKTVNKPTDQKAATISSQSPQPSPSPIVSTKTYVAESIGLSFDYPSSWKLTDATNYPYKSNSPKDIHKTIQSPEGFSVLFSTMSMTGLGGTGPCTAVKGFQNYGESKWIDSYAISTNDDNGGIVLQLSKNKTEQDANTSCLYSNLIGLSEPQYESDSTNYTKIPYAFTFGTFASYSDAAQGISVKKPSENVLNQAVNMLKSIKKN